MLPRLDDPTRGEKEYKTRCWPTRLRDCVWIHAAKGFPGWAKELCQHEPFRSVLALHGFRTWKDLPIASLLGKIDNYNRLPGSARLMWLTKLYGLFRWSTEARCNPSNYARRFFCIPTTQWTEVVEAANSGDLPRRRAAFEALCRDYWKPLYAFSRRVGHDQSDAEDLTQGFFAYLLQRSVLEAVTPEMGRLRTYLLKIFQRYIGDMRDHQNAQKRGGGVRVFSLDVEPGEELLSLDLAGAETPEMLYDRAWAQTLLRGTLQQLGAAEAAAGRGQIFAVLKGELDVEAGKSENQAAAAAASLGMSAESIRQAVSRLRKRFRDGLRERIAATLRDPDDARIDEELDALKAALRSRA